MKSKLFFFLMFFLPYTLFGQGDIGPTAVTILLQDEASIKGEIVGEYLLTVKIRTEESIQIIKRKEILGIFKGGLFEKIWNEDVLVSDVVILKNKEWIAGDIQSVSKNGVIVIKEDKPISIAMSEIDKIITKGQILQNVLKPKGESVTFLEYRKVNLKRKKSDKKKTEIKRHIKKWYNISYANFLNPQPELPEMISKEMESLNGIGLSNITGYSFSPNLNIGIGVGYFDYNYEEARRFDFTPSFSSFNLFSFIPDVIPVFIDFRLNPIRGKISPYFSIAFGSVFSVFNQDRRDELTDRADSFSDSTFDISRSDLKAMPGLYFNPSLGLNINLNGFHLLASIGLQVVNVQYHKTSQSQNVNGRSVVSIKPKHQEVRRLVFKVGLLL